jgi:hypothetical protein
MMLKRTLAAVAAMGLMVSPAVASSNAASALSLQPQAEALGSEGESSLGGGGGAIWAFVLGGVILAGFILAALENDDDDEDFPVSP